MKKVLVTGGFGFIGSYICEAILAKGYRVRVMDNLDPQVHGEKMPSYPFVDKVEYLANDVRDPAVWEKALEGIDAVFHEASAVGVGQSQYQIGHYCDVNVMGTARLMDYLANHKHTVKKMIVAASMSSYGEGRYHCTACDKTVRPELRSQNDVTRFGWEPRCTKCSGKVVPEPITEEDRQVPNSIYAINKMTQEDMFHCFGRTYGIPSVGLRYFNVFGPRQSLSNPYTGVLAIFTSRLKNGHSPVVYEDGNQTRDFIDVRDVAHANVLALEGSKADGLSINVGTGKPRPIREVASVLADVLKVKIQPEITNKFRKGDVRHCYASVERAQKLLGFTPQISFEEGLKVLAGWAGETTAVDRFQEAAQELSKRGLV